MTEVNNMEREPDDFILENYVKNKKTIEFSFKPTFKSSDLGSFLKTLSVYLLEKLIELTVKYDRLHASLSVSVNFNNIETSIEESIPIGTSPIFITRETDIDRKVKEIFEQLLDSLLQVGDDLEVKQLNRVHLHILLHKPLRITPKGATLTWSPRPTKYKRARIIDYNIAVDGAVVSTRQPPPVSNCTIQNEEEAAAAAAAAATAKRMSTT